MDFVSKHVVNIQINEDYMAQSPESSPVETKPEIIKLNSGGGIINLKEKWFNSGNIFSELLLTLGWNKRILYEISSLL